MQVSFGADLVEKWAEFSGDYNPIHFDPGAAATITDQGVVAHGMLVLLPVKQALTDVILSSNVLVPFTAGHWMRLRSSFRRPVPQSFDLNINVESSDARTTFSVSDTNQGSPYFQGLLTSAPPPGSPASGITFSLDRKSVTQQWEYFRSSFPHVVANWIFIDAFLFTVFVRRHALDFFGSLAYLEVVGKSHQTQLMVQTNQCVWFDHDYLQAIACPVDLDLTYQYASGEWIVDGSRVIGAVSLEACVEGQRVLHSDIGLLLQSTI